MKFLITILLVAIAVTSCNKRLLPPVTNTVTDSDSTVVEHTNKDTTIVIPGKTVHIHDTVPCPEAVYESVAKDSTGTLTLTTKLKDGKLDVRCDADSLRKRIAWLETNMYSFKNHTETKQVPYEVKVKEPYIPQWVWWLLAYSVGTTLWVFRKQILALFKITV